MSLFILKVNFGKSVAGRYPSDYWIVEVKVKVKTNDPNKKEKISRRTQAVEILCIIVGIFIELY